MFSPSKLLRAAALCGILCSIAAAQQAGGVASGVDNKTVRVFIFAGQSNMEGADSKVKDIQRFPPFRGLEQPQPKVRFSYCIGRKDKEKSTGWVALQSVRNMVGPELSFARRVTAQVRAPIAIIKCAAGGTHLGGDWNPDQPSGFKMYPLALEWVRAALADLKQQKVPYRIEGFMWHQGENDMFQKDYMPRYGANLTNFIARWRRDLKTPKLRFYIGELCTKTIWGMDLRPRMHAISVGQRAATKADPLAQYVPTSHVGVEIGGGVGLHYHYGTLGQLEHGVNYADAYLGNIGRRGKIERPLPKWPYAKGSKVKLFVMAGHRNMEGERAFAQELTGPAARYRQDDRTIAFRYSLGGGYRASNGYEPLGLTGYYDTFGPELSFGRALRRVGEKNFAIAKFTHSGSQIIDWTPAGSVAKTRNLYLRFLSFVREAVKDLTDRGHQVEIAGVFYHLGENDMSFYPYRKEAVPRLQSLIAGVRRDLKLPELAWFVSQQPPIDHKRVRKIDVTKALRAAAKADPFLHHLPAFELPKQAQEIVITTAGILELGKVLAAGFRGR